MSAFYALLLTATSSIWIVSQLSYGVIDLREALHLTVRSNLGEVPRYDTFSA